MTLWTDRQEFTRLLRFLVAGAINTGVGYGVFLALTLGVALDPNLANALGYAVALTVAYVIYRDHVFADMSNRPGRISRFVAAFGTAFLLNQAVLWSSIHIGGLVPYLAQVLAMAAYTVIFYTLNRLWVFRSHAALD